MPSSFAECVPPLIKKTLANKKLVRYNGGTRWEQRVKKNDFTLGANGSRQEIQRWKDTTVRAEI
jgi:hypothetical protein